MAATDDVKPQPPPEKLQPSTQPAEERLFLPRYGVGALQLTSAQTPEGHWPVWHSLPEAQVAPLALVAWHVLAQ